MGFFDKILQGLGFEGEEEEPKKVKPTKEKKNNGVSGQYILKQNEEPIVPKNRLYDIAPKTQEEVQMAVDLLKNGNSVRIDFSLLVGNSIYRAMDFVQGACFVLGIVPQKLAEKVFLMQINN